MSLLIRPKHIQSKRHSRYVHNCPETHFFHLLAGLWTIIFNFARQIPINHKTVLLWHQKERFSHILSVHCTGCLWQFTHWDLSLTQMFGLCCVYCEWTGGVHFLVQTKYHCHAFLQPVPLTGHNQHLCVSGGDGCYMAPQGKPVCRLLPLCSEGINKPTGCYHSVLLWPRRGQTGWDQLQHFLNLGRGLSQTAPPPAAHWHQNSLHTTPGYKTHIHLLHTAIQARQAILL